MVFFYFNTILISLFVFLTPFEVLGESYCIPNTYGMSVDPSYECKVSYDYKIPPSKMLADYYRNYGKIEKQLSISKESLAHFGSGVDFVSTTASTVYPPGAPIFFISGMGLKKIYSNLSEPLHREFENKLLQLGTYVINLKGQKDPLLFSNLMNQKNQYNLNELLKNQLATAVYEDPEIRVLFGDDFQKLNKEQQITTITTILKVVVDKHGQTWLDLVNSKRSIQELEEKISESFKNIQDLGQKVKTVENTIPDQIQSMAYHLHAYEKMTPEEQMAAIDKGNLFPNLSEEQKIALKNASKEEQEAQLKAQTMKELNDAYYIIVGGLDSLSKIAQSLGADPSLVEGVGHMARYAQSVISIAMAASGQPNPQAIMMAVTSIVGFFTGFSNDSRDKVEEKRFEVIMKEFYEVKKGLNTIIEGLNLSLENDRMILKNQEFILENQDIIINNQKTILETIFEMHKDISNKLHTLDVDLTSQLSDLKDKVEDNTAVLMQLLNKDLKFCSEFVYDFDFVAISLRNNFQSYDELKRYFEQKSERYKDCIKALHSIFGEYRNTQNQALHPLLYSKYYEKKEKTQIEEKRKDYETLFNYCNKHPKRKDSPSLNPFLSSPLNYDIISTYVFLLLKILPFEQVAFDSGALYNEEEYRDFKPNTGLFKKLDEAKKILEFALLQHELLAGRTCMDALYSDFQSSHPETRINLYNILEKHPILATNLFTESLHKTIKKHNHNFLMYDVFFDRETSIPALKNYFDQDWHFRFAQNCKDSDENPYKCMKAMYRASHIKLNTEEKARRTALVLEKYVTPEVDIPIYEERYYCHRSHNGAGDVEKGLRIEHNGDELTSMATSVYPRLEDIANKGPNLNFHRITKRENCVTSESFPEFTCAVEGDSCWISTRGRGKHARKTFGLIVVYKRMEIIGYKKGYPSKKIVIAEKPDCYEVKKDKIEERKWFHKMSLSKEIEVWECKDRITVVDYPKRGFEKEAGYPFSVGDPRELYVNIANSDILRGKDYVYEEEREKLLTLRSLVVSKQAEYEVLKSASQEERDAWFEMLRKKALLEEEQK